MFFWPKPCSPAHWASLLVWLTKWSANTHTSLQKIAKSYNLWEAFGQFNGLASAEIYYTQWRQHICEFANKFSDLYIEFHVIFHHFSFWQRWWICKTYNKKRRSLTIWVLKKAMTPLCPANRLMQPRFMLHYFRACRHISKDSWFFMSCWFSMLKLQNRKKIALFVQSSQNKRLTPLLSAYLSAHC